MSKLSQTQIDSLRKEKTDVPIKALAAKYSISHFTVQYYRNEEFRKKQIAYRKERNKRQNDVMKEMRALHPEKFETPLQKQKREVPQAGAKKASKK